MQVDRAGMHTLHAAARGSGISEQQHAADTTLRRHYAFRVPGTPKQRAKKKIKKHKQSAPSTLENDA